MYSGLPAMGSPPQPFATSSGPTTADRAFYHNQLRAVLNNDNAATYNFISISNGLFTGDPASGFDKVDLAAAKAAVARYSGKPTAFPVDQPLKARPDGKTIAYMQCSTPACAFFAQIIAPTQKLLGYKLKIVKADMRSLPFQAEFDVLRGQVVEQPPSLAQQDRTPTH